MSSAEDVTRYILSQTINTVCFLLVIMALKVHFKTFFTFWSGEIFFLFTLGVEHSPALIVSLHYA